VKTVLPFPIEFFFNFLFTSHFFLTYKFPRTLPSTNIFLKPERRFIKYFLYFLYLFKPLKCSILQNNLTYNWFLKHGNINSTVQYYVFIYVDYILIYVDYILICIEYVLIYVDYILIYVDYILVYVDYILVYVDYILIYVDYILIYVDYIALFCHFKAEPYTCV